MKQINVFFDDKEHEELNKIKEDHGGNWHDFLLDVIRKYKGMPRPAQSQGGASSSDTEKSRKCGVCGNELEDDEKTYCSSCDPKTEGLIPDENVEEEKK